MDPIVVRGLDHAFGEGETRKQVLFGIDLKVARGSLVVLMGPSGSGKTTLLTLMGCLRQVQAGSVQGVDCLATARLHGWVPRVPAAPRARVVVGRRDGGPGILDPSEGHRGAAF